MAINIKKRDLGTKYKFKTGGGEADIYDYDSNYLLKVFKDNVCLGLKEKKIDIWLKSNKIYGIVSPEEKVYIDGKFKSYVLENIKDADAISVFIKKKHIKLKNITNKDLVGLMLDASKKLENLHKSGKIAGDISENNILVKIINDLYIAFYIDTDSFGIGNLPADAYTDIYTDPNSYEKSGEVKMTKETDMYAFAILTFKILTRLHPFNGTYLKDDSLNTVQRMAKKISVLGKYDIKIPNMIPCWDWISPDLLKTLYEIFEKEKRCYITGLLQDLYDNMKFCDVHKNYYYSKYSKCPLCDSNAKVSKLPVVVKQKSDGKLKLYTILSNDNIEYILDFDKYINKSKKVIHLATKNTWDYSGNCNVEFTSDGKYVLEIYNDSIIIYEQNSNKKISSTKRLYKSNYAVKGNFIYYVDEELNIIKLEITNYGVVKSKIVATYAKVLLEVDKTNNMFVAILYPKEMIILTDSGNTRLKYDDKINEYAIKYDKVSKNWLFIYETNKGEHRTVVISNNQVIFDETKYKYSAFPLSNICFANNTIFAPSNKKIVGINYNKNVVKNFDNNIVTEESVLEFENGGFNIITDNKIFHYGA